MTTRKPEPKFPVLVKYVKSNHPIIGANLSVPKKGIAKTAGVGDDAPPSKEQIWAWLDEWGSKLEGSHNWHGDFLTYKESHCYMIKHISMSELLDLARFIASRAAQKQKEQDMAHEIEQVKIYEDELIKVQQHTDQARSETREAMKQYADKKEELSNLFAEKLIKLSQKDLDEARASERAKVLKEVKEKAELIYGCSYVGKLDKIYSIRRTDWETFWKELEQTAGSSGNKRG